MRNWITLLTSVFVNSVISINAMESRSYLEFDAGYRHDSVSSKFIMPSPTPLLKDRLHFKEINIFQIGLQGKTMIDYGCGNFFVRASADYGWILDGDVDEKMEVISLEEDDVEFDIALEVENILDGKYVADLSIAIGFPCYFCDSSVALAPVIGYSYNIQNYKVDRLKRSFFMSSPESPPTIELEDNCCRDAYVNSWYGPFLGIDINYTPNSCLNLYGQFEYHLTHFKGKRQSDINVGIVDDHHHSTRKAHGAIVRLGLDYMFCDCWYAGLNATYMNFRSHKSLFIGDELIEEGFRTAVGDHIRHEVKLYSLTVGVAVGRTF
jgi:hypothetical protein